MTQHLIDLSELSCECENDALEYLGKAISENQTDLWEPHTDHFVREIIELFSERGLLRTETIKNNLLEWIAGARYTGKKFKGSPPGLVYSWSKDELKLVKLYLESLPENAWQLQDYDILIQYLYQRYMPRDELKSEAEWLAVRSHLMGKAKSAMEMVNQRNATVLLSTMPHTLSAAIKTFRMPDVERNILEYSTLRAADLIVSLADANRHQIKMTVLDHFNKKFSGDKTATHEKLEQDLRDKFGEMSRDWRRIAITEAGTAANEGLVASMPIGAKVKRIEQYNGACGFCKKLHGRIFNVVSPDDPKKNGETDIWSGKSNVGRSSSPRKRMPDGTLELRRPDELWWPSAGLQHPNCRGIWITVSQEHAVSDEFTRWFNKRVGNKEGLSLKEWAPKNIK